MSFIGDCYKQLSKWDVGKAASRSAVAIFMLFVVQTVAGWQSDPNTFPHLDMVSLFMTIKMTVITFLSSLLGSYWSNSQGQLFKKDSPKEIKPK